MPPAGPDTRAPGHALLLAAGGGGNAQGFFEQENLAVSYSIFSGSRQAFLMLGTDEVDVIRPTPPPALAESISDTSLGDGGVIWPRESLTCRAA